MKLYKYIILYINIISNIDISNETKDAISKMGYEIYNQLNEKIDKTNLEIKNHIKTNVTNVIRLNDFEKGIKNIDEKLDILISKNNSSINTILLNFNYNLNLNFFIIKINE